MTIRDPHFTAAEIEGLKSEPQLLGREELKSQQAHKVHRDGRKKGSKVKKLLMEFQATLSQVFYLENKIEQSCLLLYVLVNRTHMYQINKLF